MLEKSHEPFFNFSIKNPYLKCFHGYNYFTRGLVPVWSLYRNTYFSKKFYDKIYELWKKHWIKFSTKCMIFFSSHLYLKRCKEKYSKRLSAELENWREIKKKILLPDPPLFPFPWLQPISPEVLCSFGAWPALSLIK